MEDGEEKKKYPLSSNTQLKREWRRIKDCVKRGVEEGFIGEKDGQEAMPREPKAGRIYANVKYHKPISPTGLPPCREIVSGSGANTENLGKIVDAIIKPINEKNRSFIQDTPDLLRKIQEMNSRGPQPPGTVPVSLDITALYTSIPKKKGLVVLRERLEREGMEARKVNWVVEAMSLILMSNTFSFSGRLHTQASGMSIGSVPAGAYAGVYVEKVEETALEDWRRRPGKENSIKTWYRFIDDVFLLFTGTKEEFEEFVRALNEADLDIKFTWEADWGNKSVNFLDIVISINEEGFLCTDLYSKQGIKNQLLLPSSCHPPRTCRNIIFSLALRNVRICSDDQLKEHRLEELKTRLMERKY